MTYEDRVSIEQSDQLDACCAGDWIDVINDSETSEEELIIEAPNRKIVNFESMLTDIILPDQKDLNKSPVCKYYQVPFEDTDGLLYMVLLIHYRQNQQPESNIVAI